MVCPYLTIGDLQLNVMQKMLLTGQYVSYLPVAVCMLLFY